MPEEKKRVLIVRLGSMGDIIHTLPLASALHEAFPRWEIDWLIESRWRPLLDENPCLSHIVEVDTLAWRKHAFSPNVWNAVRMKVESLRSGGYDIAIDAQGALKAAICCKLSGAREVLGFEIPWLKEKASTAFYTRKVRPSGSHIVEINLSLAAALGANPSAVRFPIPPGDPASLPAALPQLGFAVLNPGAGWRSKCWPAENYAAVADALQAEFGIPSVLNCGPGEQALSRQVQENCKLANPHEYFGNLTGLIALLRRSRLMIGPDTGPLHLATALGIPTLGLFGPTDPGRNGPYGGRHRTIRPAGAPTSYRHSAEEARSMREIRPQQAIEAVREILREAEGNIARIR